MRWTHDRIVACDGGGDVGAAGHPRVYINTDKPEIAVCGYCGVPFVSIFLSLVLVLMGGGEGWCFG